jgi:hypothetical protein
MQAVAMREWCACRGVFDIITHCRTGIGVFPPMSGVGSFRRAR